MEALCQHWLCLGAGISLLFLSAYIHSLIFLQCTCVDQIISKSSIKLSEHSGQVASSWPASSTLPSTRVKITLIVGLLLLSFTDGTPLRNPLRRKGAAPSAPPYLRLLKLHLDSVYSLWLHVLEMSTNWRLFRELQRGWLRNELKGFVRKVLQELNMAASSNDNCPPVWVDPNRGAWEEGLWHSRREDLRDMRWDGIRCLLGYVAGVVCSEWTGIGLWKGPSHWALLDLRGHLWALQPPSDIPGNCWTSLSIIRHQWTSLDIIGRVRCKETVKVHVSCLQETYNLEQVVDPCTKPLWCYNMEGGRKCYLRDTRRAQGKE